MRHLILTAVVCGFALSSLPVAAQQPPATPPTAQGRGATPPAPPVNLQILPKDIPRPELVAVMRSFTTGLGVTCDFCHVAGENGRNDFAKDDLATKQAARAMMLMVAQVNQAIATAQAAKPASEIAKVECATCHRGQAIPKL